LVKEVDRALLGLLGSADFEKEPLLLWTFFRASSKLPGLRFARVFRELKLETKGGGVGVSRPLSSAGLEAGPDLKGLVGRIRKEFSEARDWKERISLLVLGAYLEESSGVRLTFPGSPTRLTLTC